MKNSTLILYGFVCLLITLIISGSAMAQTPTPGTRDALTPTPDPTLEPLIIGGTIASPGEYPWMTALVKASKTNPYEGQYCGGSLIAPGWVLTAAHCVFNGNAVINPSTVDVVVGINNLSDGPTSGSLGQRLDVIQVIPNPNYNSTSFDSDLALLKLAAPASLNNTVQVIQPVSPGQAALFPPGVLATVTGWGTTTNDYFLTYPDELYEVSVPIVSNSTCNSAYGGGITANMLCAGLAEGGKDSCYGDSGGPLIVPDGAGGWLQAGIVSWGEGCALEGYYGVYTRLAQFESWIQSLVDIPDALVYLPFISNSSTSGASCTPSPSGDADNVGDALIVCSGQTVNGQVDRFTDPNDVFKILANAGQHLSLTLSGSGGDADLLLFPPSVTNVNTDTPSAYSAGDSNNENIEFNLTTSGYWYIDVYGFGNIFESTTNYSLSINVSG